MEMTKPFGHVVIENPKRNGGSAKIPEETLYPYYAGYSKEFAEQLLGTISQPSGAVILDPWNGGGTTTLAASQMGLASMGFDLNPAMVIVAKASLVPQQETASLVPLAQSIAEQAVQRNENFLAEDPLAEWLSPSSAQFARQLENEINRTLVSHGAYCSLAAEKPLRDLSALGALYYVALFRAVRRILRDFIPTNPTWVKRPGVRERKRPSRETVHELFVNEVRLLAQALSRPRNYCVREDGVAAIGLGNAEMLFLDDESVDTVITSPPYCTRIDYAVATAVELSVLRISGAAFDKLRRSLMGTSTVGLDAGPVSPNWGGVCATFLEAVYEHASKASKTYYYKNHYQYYSSLYKSISELGRVLKSGGACVLVIQDSYYKDIHNDVPAIAAEMAENVGMVLRRRDDFPSKRSMVHLNHRAKKYVASRNSVESVLCFERT